VPDVFVKIVQQPNYLHLSSYSETSTRDVSIFHSSIRVCCLLVSNDGLHNCFCKQGLTVTCSKRGGDVCIPSHSKWLQTVPKKPDAIMFKFVPITSLLTGIPGSGYLSHAINLYLRCKSWEQIIPVSKFVPHYTNSYVVCFLR
jgi:hypothetical protein